MYELTKHALKWEKPKIDRAKGKINKSISLQESLARNFNNQSHLCVG